MDISSQIPRLPLLDLQTHSPTRPSSAISEVLGPRERIDAIVRHVVKLETAVPTDPRTGQQQRQDLYRVVLQVGSRNIEALINRSLQPGQQLSIRAAPNQQVQVVAVDGRPVAATGAGQAGSTPAAAAAPARPDLVTTLVDALRQHLPGQQDSAPLLRNLALLLTTARTAAVAPATPAAPGAGAPAAASVTPPLAAGSTPVAAGPPTSAPAPPSAPAPAAPGIPRLPPAVTRALGSLLSGFPTPAQVTEPRGLQQAVRDSGLFLEARLAETVRRSATSGTDARAAAAAITRTDAKAALLRTFSALEAQARGEGIPQLPRHDRPLTPDQVLRVLAGVSARASAPAATGTPAGTGATVPGEALQLGFPAPVSVAGTAPTLPPGGALDLALSVLLRQLAANISRVTVQQVQTAAAQQVAGADPGTLNSWQVELPVRHADGGLHVFQLRIDEEERGGGTDGNDEEKVRQWKVTLAFDLPPLGPMYAQIRLREQHVATRFWAERQATLEAVRAELDGLKERLGALGLQVEELDCMQGAPPVRRTTLSQQLVDIRT